MRISLVIPAYNEEKYIGACLESVQKYGKELFEVIVVNNASTDRTAEIAESFSFVRLVNEPKKGLLWARQKGFEEAKGDLLAYIDSDCHLSPNWFKMILKEFSENGSLISLSGPPRYYDLPPLRNFLARLSWWISAPISYHLVSYMIFGANFTVKRKAIEKINGFNINIPFHGEDTDLARRLSPYGKVKFRMDFFIYTSGRRVIKEGLFKSFLTYGMNFLWQVFFEKPLTKSYEDHR